MDILWMVKMSSECIKDDRVCFVEKDFLLRSVHFDSYKRILRIGEIPHILMCLFGVTEQLLTIVI